MNDFKSKRPFDNYNIIPNFSDLAPDSIRYPPNTNIPNGLINTPKLKQKIAVDNAALTPNLENFAHMYQQMAASLLNMSLNKLIPPGHPLYTKENSVILLKEEKEKILKENLELKKKCLKCKKDIHPMELHKLVMYLIEDKFTEHHYEHVECPGKFTV